MDSVDEPQSVRRPSHPLETSGQAGGSRPGARKHSPARGKKSNILTVALLACALYFLLPLVWLAISSTKTRSDLYSTFGFAFGSHFDLFANISRVFSNRQGIFGQWFLNTVYYAGVSAGGAAVLTAAG